MMLLIPRAELAPLVDLCCALLIEVHADHDEGKLLRSPYLVAGCESEITHYKNMFIGRDL